MSRQYTIEECRDMFMHQVAVIAAYWARHPDVATAHERCMGVAFSILSMIDGSNVELPAFDLVPCPHEDDQEYCRENDENWWPRVPDDVRDTLPVINDTQLHEFWCNYEPEPPRELSQEKHPRYMTPAEAAEYLRVSKTFLNDRRYKGGGPPHIKMGSRVVYRTVDLDEWAARQIVVENSGE